MSASTLLLFCSNSPAAVQGAIEEHSSAGGQQLWPEQLLTAATSDGWVAAGLSLAQAQAQAHPDSLGGCPVAHAEGQHPQAAVQAQLQQWIYSNSPSSQSSIAALK